MILKGMGEIAESDLVALISDGVRECRANRI